MSKIEAYGFVDGGSLELVDPASFKDALKLISGEVRLTVERRRDKRSNQQNAYLWGVVYPAVREGLMEQGFDFTMEEVHEAMKWKFLQKHEEGIELPTVRSTTSLTTVEFSEYKEKIQRWAAEYLHKDIPDPQENL